MRLARHDEIGFLALLHENNGHLLLDYRVRQKLLKSIHRLNEELCPWREWRRD